MNFSLLARRRGRAGAPRAIEVRPHTAMAMAALMPLAEAAWDFRVPHDWAASPMPAYIAYILFALDLVEWAHYYIERDAVRRAHRKYVAHGSRHIVRVHAFGAVLETVLGLAAVLSPRDATYARLSAAAALCLTVPTGLVLSPRVWGLKHITVPGYIIVGCFRAFEAYRVVAVDHRTLPNLWILLHTAMLVRLMGFFLVPYTSVEAEREGIRGDLITDPLTYTLTVVIATVATLIFVYPPFVLAAILPVFFLARLVWPPRLSTRRLPREAK